MADIVKWLRAAYARTTVIDIRRLDEAADEIDRLWKLIREQPHTLIMAYEDGDHSRLVDAAMKYKDEAEILREDNDRLRARGKDLTLEGLSLIGRLEAIEDALAGADIGSLPNDYPIQKMAQDRMAENATLRADNDRLRVAIECALRQLADNMTVSATATLCDALGEKA